MEAPLVAIITGASTSIGKTIAMALAKKGFKLALTDSLENRESGIELCGDLKAQTSTEVVFACVKQDIESIGKLLRQFKITFSRIDALINCQSIPPSSSYSNADAHSNIFNSTFFFSTTFIQNILSAHDEVPEDGYSIITFTASAKSARLGGPILEASSRAVVSLTKTLARDNRKSSIRCNVISTGYINTAQFHELLEFTNHTLHTLEEKNRIISPQDLVDVTELLLSNSCISGQEIEVDGGLNLE